MSEMVTSAIIGSLGGLFGGLVAAGMSYFAAKSTLALEQAKLVSAWTRSEEVAKRRVEAYTDLWKRIEPMSTYYGSEKLVENLQQVQARLHEWYYDLGGGLVIVGAAEDPVSTKAAYFSARDLQGTEAYEIWQTFHRLRTRLRCDLGIFESPAAESKAMEDAKKRLGTYAK